MHNERGVEQEKIRFLSLGDSYTIGVCVDLSECWPMQLTAALRRAGLVVAEPVILARNGWTTGDLLAGVEATGLKGVFDLVTLQIGVNNQYQGLGAGSYRMDFKDLLQRAIRYGGGQASKVVVLSIPDWGVTPFADGRDRGKIAKEIDRYNRSV
jgi:hypothetical protein